jgi:phosphonate transport system substrate-binding protein
MNLTRRNFSVGILALLLSVPLVTMGCEKTPPAEPTTEASTTAPEKPTKLVFGFIPSQEADTIADTAKPMADFVSKEIGIPIDTFTSTDYSGLVEAMGSGKVDIGSFGPFAYVLAKDQGAADVILKTSRKGTFTYPWMFVVRSDSGIKKIEDAKGKKIAFVDPTSTSGYLYPAYFLKKNSYEPDEFFKQVTFAGSHDTAIRSVYTGDVDVAAVYDDVRDKMTKSLADVKEKTAVIYTSKGTDNEIPNDAIAVRPALPEELKAKIKEALLKYAEDPEGKKVLDGVYGVDALADARDSEYDPVREVAKLMGVNMNMFKKK